MDSIQRLKRCRHKLKSTTRLLSPANQQIQIDNFEIQHSIASANKYKIQPHSHPIRSHKNLQSYQLTITSNPRFPNHYILNFRTKSCGFPSKSNRKQNQMPWQSSPSGQSKHISISIKMNFGLKSTNSIYTKQLEDPNRIQSSFIPNTYFTIRPILFGSHLNQ